MSEKSRSPIPCYFSIPLIAKEVQPLPIPWLSPCNGGVYPFLSRSLMRSLQEPLKLLERLVLSVWKVTRGWKREDERLQQRAIVKIDRDEGGWCSSTNSLLLKRTSLPVKSFVYGDMIDAFDARQFENTLVERAITSFLFFTYGNLYQGFTRSSYPFNRCLRV